MNEHLERLIRSLSDPSVYPHHPDSVRVIQTHISVVFLAGELVYKIKKPLFLGFLDFTTLEKRNFFCHQEVGLNSRFSNNIYLGVVSIFESSSGIVSLGGEGRVIEYAVLMRLIPENKILKNALALDLVSVSTIEKVADSIRYYHSKASRGPQISIFGAPEVITQNIKENFSQTESFIGKTISNETFKFIKYSSLSFVEQKRALLEQRVKEGDIRDCHGDLHLDHVVLLDQIMLVDCIEFNDRFRYSDCLADIAFLLMDLDFSGYPAFSDIVRKQYLIERPDEDCQELLRFYKVYRAYVRGKVQSFTLNEPEIDADYKLKALLTASDYFRLARSYLEPSVEPTLVIMCGLMGTGKSFLASKLALRLGIQSLRSDVIRKLSLGFTNLEHSLDKYREGIYTRESSDKVYSMMLDEAGRRLSRREHVIIDASFQKLSHRIAARRLARKHKAKILLIHCITPDNIIHARLIERIQRLEEPSDGRWELLNLQKSDFDPVGPDEKDGYLEYNPNIDTNKFLTKVATQISFGIGNNSI